MGTQAQQFNVQSLQGNSLLHYVAEVGCEWAMRVLLKHTPIRLVVAERNRHGFSPYALAVLNERDACALLIEPWIAQSLAALSDNTNSHDQRERAIYKANIDMRKSILANGGKGEERLALHLRQAFDPG